MMARARWQEQATERYRAALIAHGAWVLAVGLLSGMILVFAMLEGIRIWPLLDIAADIPGSVRGWRAAHVGGLLNGVLLIAAALTFVHLPMSYNALRFVYWSLVATGWGNTVFYWAGNLSANRGLSVTDTPYGEGDVYGAIAYVAGGGVMVFTLIAAVLLALAGLRARRRYGD